MAVCPYCQVKDKPFFSGKCYACTAEVTFGEQVVTSIIWTIVPIGTIVLLIWLLMALLG